MPLNPISEKQDHMAPKDASAPPSSTAGTKKKLCLAAPCNLRRNGRKSSSKDREVVANGAASTSNAKMEATDATMKVPIDPPGAVLGALPLMHYTNGQHMPGPYRGGADHPSFHPVFPTMENWQGAGHHAFQQWAIPPFLAPLAATAHHQFAHFIAGNGSHENTWTPNGGGANNHYSHMVHNNVYFDSRGGVYQNHGGVPPSDAEDVMSIDESMASTDGIPGVKEIETEFIPSTFAPPEVVEKIKAKNEAASKLAVVQPRQTRSMTAKKNRERRDSVRLQTAHQACSPKSHVSRGMGSKVAVADDAIDSIDSPAPQVMTILGKRVTMIDPVRKVFVIDLLSPEVCDQIRMMADNHTREIHKSGSNAEIWRTLYTYTKMDLPVVEVKNMVKKYTENILNDVKKIVGEIFGGPMRKEAMKLRPRSWKEPHLLLYQRLDDRPQHTGIEMHYDGCDITCKYYRLSFKT